MSRYYLNVLLHVRQILQNILINDTMILWLSSLLEPIQQENNLFVELADRQILYAKHNNQIGVHEHLLNELFAPYGGIFITDGNPSSEVFLYNFSEGIDNPVFLYNHAETPVTTEAFFWDYNEAIDTVDYYVNVPIAVYALHADQIKATCNMYKPGGKNYKILTY